jgi:excisionase family DNA binding protein
MALDKKTIRSNYNDLQNFLNQEINKHQCNCGCNEIIPIKKIHFWNGIPHFIFGHASRLRAVKYAYEKDKYISVEDLANLAKVSVQTVRVWTHKKKITAIKILGKKQLYKREVLDLFLKERPEKIPLIEENYVTIQDLKRMGVSRSKLRILVRAGKIQEPRYYRRKTFYLRDEVSQYLDQISEDSKSNRRRNQFSQHAFNKMLEKIAELEKRTKVLELSLNK